MIDAHAPTRRFRAPRTVKVPWYDDKIDTMKKLRDYYHRRATIGNLAKDWQSYRTTRNKITTLVRQAKKDYYTTMLSQSQGNAKSTWKILKDLLPKTSSSGVTSLMVDGSLLTDFKDISNAFNNFFTNISTQLATAIKIVSCSPLDYLSKFIPDVNCTFKFKTVYESDVLKLISSIPNGKATGIDNIQVRILKMSAPAIANSLSHLFNMSLSSGQFPSDWKLARITPLFKKGNKTEPGNYRPVSVLPVVSKFIERIVHQQLYRYLTANKLLCEQQSGFRKKHSCQTSLHKLTEQVYDDLYKGHVVGLIALDLKKAFDTVHHGILLKKLRYYGIQDTELCWFKSYLSDRCQMCNLFNNLSDPEHVVCGVPQGSIVGPLLFTIYVNDMPVCFSKCSVNLYADDTVFFHGSRDVGTVRSILQSELVSVYEWLCANRLSLHIGKTNSMLVCSRQKRVHLQDSNLSLSLENDNISQVDNLKYLGLVLDERLRYDDYMKQLIGKLKRSLGVLRRASKFIDQVTRVTLYNTLILPHIDYCSTV